MLGTGFGCFGAHRSRFGYGRENGGPDEECRSGLGGSDAALEEYDRSRKIKDHCTRQSDLSDINITSETRREEQSSSGACQTGPSHHKVGSARCGDDADRCRSMEGTSEVRLGFLILR